MNNTSNNQKQQNNTAYTDPSVPKASTLFSIVFSSIFLFFGTLIPLPFSIIFLIFGSALTAKAFSAKNSPFPFISLIFPIILGFFVGFEPVILSVTAFLCGLIMFEVLKHGGGKTSAIIGSTTLIVLFSVSALLVYVYKNYGGISIDDFSDLIDDLRQSFAAFVDSILKDLSNQINDLPESAQKTSLISMYKSYKELFSDTDVILDLMLYILPGTAILLANVISYFSATIYFFTVKENTGHTVFATQMQSQLTVSTIGVVIYSTGYLFLAISSLFSAILGLISLNFVIIYTPVHFVIGIKSILNPQIRKRNKFLIGAALLMLFFNPLLALFLVGFIGANTVMTESVVNFMKKHHYDDNK